MFSKKNEARLTTKLKACGAIRVGECTPITQLAKLYVRHEGTSIQQYEATYLCRRV